jgi:flavin reductase (DIM6/NTAB) family NADH-FMN oxidoreductase RutF
MREVTVPDPEIYRLLHPRPVVLVSCVDPNTGKPNIITVAWSLPLSVNPPLVGISIALKRYSHELIQKSGEFVVNIPTMEILEKVAGCGSVSGKNVDKFSRFGLTPKQARVIKAPAIEECVAYLECKLIDAVKTGDHTFFVGEVVAAYAEEGVFESGMIDLKKVRGVYHLGGRVYCTVSPELVGPR